MRYIVGYILLVLSLGVQAQVRTFHTTETDSVNIMTSPKVDTFKTYVRRQPSQTVHINLLYPRRSGTLALEDSSDFDSFMHGHEVTKQRPPYRADPFCIYYPLSNLLLNGYFVDSMGTPNNLSCNWYGGADPSNVNAPLHGFFWNAANMSGSIRAIEWIKVDTSHYYQLFYKIKIYHYGGFYGADPSWVHYGGLEYKYMKDSDTTFSQTQGLPKWGYSMTRFYGGSAMTTPDTGPYGFQETQTVPMSMVVGPRKGFESVNGVPDNAPWGPYGSEGWDQPSYQSVNTDYPTPPLPALSGFHMQIPYDSGWSLYVRPKFYMEAPFEGFNSGVGNYVQISEISFKDVSPTKSGGFADTVRSGMATIAMLKDSASALRAAIRDSLLVQSSLYSMLYATKQALRDTASVLRGLAGNWTGALVDSASHLRGYTQAIETKVNGLSFATLNGTNTWTNLQTFNAGFTTLADRIKMGASIIGGIVQEVAGQTIDLGVNFSQLTTVNGFYNSIYLRLAVNAAAGSDNFTVWWNSSRMLSVSSGGDLIATGSIKGTQYSLPNLNTPPSTASSTGVKGEIRFATDGYLYLCTATNTWVRAQLVTW